MEQTDALATLLARQMRRWQIAAREGMPRPQAPIVALSRWAGSEGEAVAERVAAWLDYGVFGAAEIDCIAANPSLRSALRVDLDPERAKVLEDLVARAARRAPAAPLELIEVVATLGVRGMAVVVGRGAAALLPPERALRVLIVAPLDLRVERLAAAQGIAHDEAQACLVSADAARRAALAGRFGIASEDLTQYDLVLNTEALAVDAVAALVVDAFRRRFPVR